MRAHVVTFGCQMNEYDTHAIQSELAGIGYSFVEDYRDADLVLVRGNPAATIADVEKVDTVFKDGVGYDSGKLLESVRGRYGRY